MHNSHSGLSENLISFNPEINVQFNCSSMIKRIGYAERLFRVLLGTSNNNLSGQQRAIASKPASCVKAYLYGGLAWYVAVEIKGFSTLSNFSTLGSQSPSYVHSI